MAVATATSAPPKTALTYLSYTFDLKRADQIPNYCTKLAQILDQSPLFDGREAPHSQCKVMALENRKDPRICAIFNTNSRKILGDFQAWHIYDFGYSGYSAIWTQNGAILPQGVSLWLYSKFKMCPLELLEQSYNQVYSAMTTGWTPVKIEDHPNMSHAENPEEFDLFIKEKPLLDEAALISAIAMRFSLQEDLVCDNHWAETRCENLYLWIRKSALPNVVEKFGFKLT